MSREDVILSAVLSIIVLCLFVFCYNKLFAVTFDENFAKATGVNVELYNVLIAVLTAVTIVLGMRMMGAMLISSLIIFPALTAMRIFKSFRGVVICSGVLAVVCFLFGIIFSYGCSTRRCQCGAGESGSVYRVQRGTEPADAGDKKVKILQQNRTENPLGFFGPVLFLL